jgi:hypothetical protein
MQEVNVPIGKPRASPLLSLNTDEGTESAKHFDYVISTCCEDVVEVFESLTTSF